MPTFFLLELQIIIENMFGLKHLAPVIQNETALAIISAHEIARAIGKRGD